MFGERQEESVIGVEPSSNGGGFAKHWGWFITLDSISNNNPKDYNYYTSMNIKAFLTLLSFYKDKQDMQELALRNANK